MSDSTKSWLELIKTALVVGAVAVASVLIIGEVKNSRKKLLEDMIKTVQERKADILAALDMDKILETQTRSLDAKLDRLRTDQSAIDRKIDALKNDLKTSRAILDRTAELAKIALAEQNKPLSADDFRTETADIEKRLSSPVKIFPSLTWLDNSPRKAIAIHDGQLRAENALFKVADQQVKVIEDQGKLIDGNTVKIGNLDTSVATLNGLVQNWQERYQNMFKTVQSCQETLGRVEEIANKLKKRFPWEIAGALLGGVALGRLIPR